MRLCGLCLEGVVYRDCHHDLLKQGLESADQEEIHFELISIKMNFRSRKMSEINLWRGYTNPTDCGTRLSFISLSALGPHGSTAGISTCMFQA